MGFLFGGPKFQYGQIGGPFTNELVQGLNNFNPWGYMPSMGLSGKQARQDMMDFYGNKDYSQIGSLKAPLAALNQNYANINKMADRNLASGDAALQDSGILKQQTEQLRNQNATQQGADAMNLVAGGYEKAANRYQDALNARRGFGLQASGQALQGKQGALSGYLDSFKPPTGYSGGLFGGILQGAGALAGALTTGATGGASAGLGALLGGGNRMAAPGSQAGSTVSSAANSIGGNRMIAPGSQQGGWGQPVGRGTGGNWSQKKPVNPYGLSNMGNVYA